MTTTNSLVASGTASPQEKSGTGWLLTFGALALVSGTTIGMSKVMASLFGLRLGATDAEIGIIGSLQSFAMAAATLPAGIVVARFGARSVYLVASAGCMLAYLWTAGSGSWLHLAVGVTAAAAFIPSRIVAMSGSFMAMLPRIGLGKAGWYRACLSAGMVLIGPGLGTIVMERLGVSNGFVAVAALFGAMAVFGPAALLPRRPQPAERSLGNDIGQMLGLMRHPVVTGVCAIELAAGVVQTFFSTFILPIAIRGHAMSEPGAVTLLFVEGAVAVATMFAAGPLLRGIAAPRIYRLSFALGALGLGLLGIAAGYVGLAAGTLALGLGQGVTHIVNVRQLSAVEADKGRLASLQLTASMSGGFMGSLVGGAVGQQIGLQPMFLSGAALFAALALRMSWKSRPRA